MIRSTEQTLFRLDNLNREQQRISYQMSTGKKLERGSDDSNLYTREIYVDDKIRVYEGLKVQIEKTTAQNNTADSTLKEAKNLLTYVKAEVIKALNATTDSESKLSIAVNLRGVKENLFALANESVEGEYLYGGSNTQIKPFSQDASGKVTYEGDGFLRKVAVEDGSYRERGITGFETFMYTSSSALKGENLEFDVGERILDQDNYEWQMRQVSPGATTGTLNFNANQPLVDDTGKVWTLNTAIPQLEDDSGNNIPVTGAGPYTVDMDAVTTTVASFNTAELVQYDEDGNTVESNTMAVTVGVDKSFSVTVSTDDGTKFESKASMFDVMDKIINALEQKDSDGNAVSEEIALDSLREGLGEITQSFEAANVGHAKLGGRNQVFELSLNRVSSKLTQFHILSQELGAADLSKVAVEAKALELTYTALYSTINKMNELSLVNFIR
jgi:flagellar hook-associated protein 3 FlgL